MGDTAGRLGGGAGRGVAKQVKVERPRPLKLGGGRGGSGGGPQPELSQEDVLAVMAGVRRSLAAGEAGLVTGLAGQQLVAQLQLLSANLILIGPSLELTHKVGLL